MIENEAEATRGAVDSQAAPRSRPPLPCSPPTASSPLPTPSPSAEAGQRPTETVRVDIDRLDHLMDLAGQLVINKAQFVQIGDNFRSVLGVQALGASLEQGGHRIGSHGQPDCAAARR